MGRRRWDGGFPLARIRSIRPLKKSGLSIQTASLRVYPRLPIILSTPAKLKTACPAHQLPKKKSPNPSSSLCSIILQTLYVRNHHPPNPKNPWSHLSTRSIMLSKNGSTSEPHQSKKWSTTCLRQKSIQ